jgi:hypothetical protein
LIKILLKSASASIKAKNLKTVYKILKFSNKFWTLFSQFFSVFIDSRNFITDSILRLICDKELKLFNWFSIVAKELQTA